MHGLLTPFLIPQIVLTTRANKEQPADLELIAAVRCLIFLEAKMRRLRALWKFRRGANIANLKEEISV